MFEKYVKNKSAGSFICLVAAILALVTAILYFATQAASVPQGHEGIAGGIVLMVGFVLAIVLYLLPVRFGPIVLAIVNVIALVLVVYQVYFVFADVINNVTYAGGNLANCLAYIIGSALASIAAVAACFFPLTRDGSEIL